MCYRLLRVLQDPQLTNKIDYAIDINVTTLINNYRTIDGVLQSYRKMLLRVLQDFQLIKAQNGSLRVQTIRALVRCALHRLTRLESCSTIQRKRPARRPSFFSDFSSPLNALLVQEVPSVGGKKWRSLELSGQSSNICRAPTTVWRQLCQLVSSTQPNLSASHCFTALSPPPHSSRFTGCARELLQPSNDRVESSQAFQFNNIFECKLARVQTI